MSVVSGKSVLVTGGTGTFGKAFLRRCLDDGVRRIVILSRDELKQAEMRAAFPDPRVRYFIGDVRDQNRVLQALNGVEIVVHAAAMKRIETCEADPWEAVQTNVIGTHNVADAAIHAGVEKAVLLSTDKAPAAHTLYGVTKLAAERLWLASNVYAAGHRTTLSATRYGNVLGSRGSVLDLFRQQVERGVPATITHLGCTRFWMSIEQAVDLVLVALTNMQGGEVFVGKVPSAPVVTLAKACGASQFSVTGLRPGERLHETLISADEARTTVDAGTHYVIEPESRPWVSVETSRAPVGPPVSAGFTYRSDSNPDQLDADGLRRLVA